ncbi:MAG TPA: hypothetical protein VGB72_04535 [Acidobacteriota bacterium]
MKHSANSIRALCLGLALGVALVGVVQAQEPPQPSAPQQTAVSVLKEISFQKVEIAEQLMVTIKVEGPFLIETTELVVSKRLIIDFNSVSMIEAQPITQVNDMGLLNIRTGQFQPTVARVVFDLADNFPSHRISSDKDGVKVVFGKDIIRNP